MRLWRGPTVLDADALSMFEGDAASLAALLGGRPALITPHVVEFGRLADMTPDVVLANRYDVGRELARALGCVVLLKGVPTVIHAPGGRGVVVAAGTPVLATGGSGDVLTGIAGTLVAQMGDPMEAAACAAWIHGRASERVGEGGIRGATLDDVVAALAHVWAGPPPVRRPPVLAELPAVGDRAASAARPAR